MAEPAAGEAVHRAPCDRAPPRPHARERSHDGRGHRRRVGRPAARGAWPGPDRERRRLPPADRGQPGDRPAPTFCHRTEIRVALCRGRPHHRSRRRDHRAHVARPRADGPHTAATGCTRPALLRGHARGRGGRPLAHSNRHGEVERVRAGSKNCGGCSGRGKTMSDYNGPELNDNELERDLRATFDRLADDAHPSADLVDRTVERGAQLRRHRRLAAASAVVVLAVTAGATSIAAAGTHHTPVHVSGPDADETGPATTSTTAPASPTTVVSPALAPTHSAASGRHRPRRSAPRRPLPKHRRRSSAARHQRSSTTAAEPSHRRPTARSSSRSNSPTTRWRKKLGWALDDGTAGFGTLTKTYTPDQFGPHSFVEWSVDATTFTYVDCPTRHNFTVGSVPTTTTVAPETTTTTIPPPVP